MTPERWARVKEVLAAAMELPEDDRNSWLQDICGTDDDLKCEVETLLRERTGARLPESPVKESDLAGQSIAHYRILERLGEGGMGVVYRALDTHLDRPVAIKVLRGLTMTGEKQRHRFVQEAKAASALNQPGIVTVHDIHTLDGSDFIIMEYIEGRTLDRVVRAEDLAPEVALDYAVQLAEAMAAAHEAGIVHRDIKPANIMVTDSGHLKVLDFGLAKISEVTPSNETRSALTDEGAIMGTVAYMSPEQAQGRPVDARTDVFSFGVVLYEMLTGRRPFQGESRMEVLSAILRETPTPLKQLRRHVPLELERIVVRCLEKDRERRYASAAKLREELADCRARLAASDVRALFRKPQVAVPALLLLAALIATGTWLVVQSRRQSWARNVALPEITRLVDDVNFDAAFRLGAEAERYIPDDRDLLETKKLYAREAHVGSRPPGADVYVKGYRNLDAEWVHLGQTPIDGTLVPVGYLRWKVTRDGTTPAEGALSARHPVRFTLHSPEETPAGMVPVPGGDYQLWGLARVELEDFWLDKYEVTNSQYQEFVDQGGYQNPEHWKHPFVKDGKVVSWGEAVGGFLDATGRLGPATWELGAYPEGRGDFPVNGVSWYEAAAYAEFAGKALPTLYHWLRAAPNQQFSDILWLSNFGGTGPAQGGTHQGLSTYGNYDMAGNVREWCWNAVSNTEGARRYIMGASWTEAAYQFLAPSAANPWDRSPTNGFRCAKYATPPVGALTAPIESVSRDYTKEKPVDDKIFEVYRSFYSYKPADLNSMVEEVDDSSPHWRREKVTFNAAYGDERVIAYLLLPRNGKPPYQTIVYFASLTARLSTSSDQLGMELMCVDFLPRIGRAVLFLVYKGTYERHFDIPAMEMRDLVICWSRDFSRSIDYLETRADVDHRNLGYYSVSNPLAPVLSAIDGRIKAGAHAVSGFFPKSVPPEFDPLNFAPRAKEPTLLLAGRYDFVRPVETSQVPMLRFLGAQGKDKRLALLDAGHVFKPGPEAIKEVLDWFDRYLGPVELTP